MTRRTAVVTGGAGGIGRAAVERLTRDGFTVVFVDIDGPRSAETARDTGAQAVVGDVTTEAGIAALRDALGDTTEVHALVNNVGHYLRPTPFAKSTPEHWDALDAINLRHVFAVTHALLPRIVAARGAIVNVSSVEGLRGYPVDPVYGAYKAAVIHFTRCLALELGGRGVRVNAIGPDITQSLQVDYSTVPEDERAKWQVWAPLGRMGHPEDQADVIAFLVSEDARFVTGHCIPTDGGTLAGGGWFRIPGTGRWTNRP
jgi:NAD(P)-dependent dehydrogenase (short-subunit alcohol dehydrogenase family)